MHISKCPRCGQKNLQKYGHKQGKQQYRCTVCAYQFCPRQQQPAWIKRAYQAYADSKQTLPTLSCTYQLSIPTLRKYFDNFIQQALPLSQFPKM